MLLGIDEKHLSVVKLHLTIFQLVKGQEEQPIIQYEHGIKKLNKIKQN